MGDRQGFLRAGDQLFDLGMDHDKTSTANGRIGRLLSMDRNVSVFETSIRLVGHNIDRIVLVIAHSIWDNRGFMAAYLLMPLARIEVTPNAEKRWTLPMFPQPWERRTTALSQALLSASQEVAHRLLPAFATPTGIPYGTVRLSLR